MTGVIQNTGSLITETDSVLATGQGDGAITAARVRQLMEDVVVSSINQLFVQLGNYADDAAAAIGGVPIDGLYRNGNFICVRLS